MARIRTIKPEFWSSPSMRGADPWARLLFVAMWNWADDTGRGTANVRELAAFAFPDEDDPIAPTVLGLPALLAEVRDRWGVIFYEVSGRRYYAIPSWDEHQRNERRAKSRYPGPDEGQEYDPDPSGGGSDDERRNFRDGAAEVSARSNGVSRKLSPSPDRPMKSVQSEWITDDEAEDRSEGPETGREQPQSERPPRTHGTSVHCDGSSVPGTGEQGNRGTDKGGRKRPQRALPADWQPSPSNERYADEKRLNLDSQADQFRAHALATDRRLANWDQGFRQWLAKSAEWSKPKLRVVGGLPLADDGVIRDPRTGTAIER